MTPKKCIPVEEAKEIQANWMNTRARFIETGMKEKDCCEFTLDIDELQEYITYVKQESVAQGIPAPALRLYFAAYNSAASKKATIFLAPTHSNDPTSKNNYKIPPLNMNTGGDPPNEY